jgi:hypothetical protein
MREFDVCYEYGDEVSDVDEACEVFLERFLEDISDLRCSIEQVDYEPEDNSMVAVLKTEARITDEWFDNADYAVRLFESKVQPLNESEQAI